MVTKAASTLKKQAPPPDFGWVSLGRASVLLGVNEATLRRWANEGKVRTFVTPGGHRRFAQRDLLQLVEGRTVGRRRAKLAELLRDHYDESQEVRLETLATRPWYVAMSDATKARLRSRGNMVLTLIEDFLGGHILRNEAATQLRQIGRDYGRDLAESGLSSAEALEAYTLFRRWLLETIRQVAQRQTALDVSTVEAMQACSDLLDELTVPLVEAFDDSAVQTSNRSEGAGEVI